MEEIIKIMSPKPFSIDFSEFRVELKKGEYAIPLFQRNFVWTHQKICKLMDSIYRYYPIGSFLIWKTKEKTLFKKSKDFLEYTEHDYIKYVLDGQQRIVSLSIILFGNKIIPDKKKTHLEPLNFCLDMVKVFQNEESVFVYTDEHPDEVRYFSLYNILNGHYVDEYGDLKIKISEDQIKKTYYSVKSSNKIFEINSNELKRNLNKCKDHFEKYKFSIIELDDSGNNISQANRGKYIDRMCESFIRVNNQGTKLTTVNLVMASLFDEKFNLQEEIESFKKGLGNQFNELPDEAILQTISLILKDNISKNTMLKLKANEIEEEWKNIKRAFSLALDRLISTFKMKNSKFLPYPVMLPILSGFYYSSRFNEFLPDQISILKKWFWISSFSNRYSGKDFLDNVISDKKKFDILGKIAFNEKNEKNKLDLNKEEIVEAQNLGENIIINFNQLREDIIKTRYKQRSSIKSAVFCLYANKKIIDLETGEPVNLDDIISDLNKKENHHIFPQSKFRGKYHISSVANICFLSKKVNNYISNKLPSNYLEKYSKYDHFKKSAESLYIPVDKDSGVWGDNFEAFLKNRSSLIVNEIEKLTGCKSNIEEEIDEGGLQLINQFEIKLRNFIDNKMTSAYGEYWWKRVPGGVKKSVQESLEIKKKKEPALDESLYTTRWGRNLLDLTNFDHLRQIITSHWNEVFKQYFKGSPERFSNNFEYIRDFRNKIYHSNEPEEELKDFAMGSLKTFNKVLKFSE